MSQLGCEIPCLPVSWTSILYFWGESHTLQIIINVIHSVLKTYDYLTKCILNTQTICLFTNYSSNPEMIFVNALITEGTWQEARWTSLAVRFSVCQYHGPQFCHSGENSHTLQIHRWYLSMLWLQWARGKRPQARWASLAVRFSVYQYHRGPQFCNSGENPHSLQIMINVIQSIPNTKLALTWQKWFSNTNKMAKRC